MACIPVRRYNLKVSGEKMLVRIPDIAAAIPVPGPALTLLKVVTQEVERSWSDFVNPRRVRTADWEDVELAARFFHFRRLAIEEYLRTETQGTSPRFPRYARMYRLATMASLAMILLWSVTFALSGRTLLPSTHDVLLSIMNVIVFSHAFVVLLIDRLWGEGFESVAAHELAEINNFGRAVPPSIALLMDSPDLAGKGLPEEERALAKSDPSYPIAPPGLTEMTLAKNSAALDNIANQLQTTRVIDVSMTVGSFAAFLVTIGMTIWMLATGQNISFAVAGAGGSGLLGAFSFYSTARARTSQIALAMFESLVVELRISLVAAARLPEDIRATTEKAAWRLFRDELTHLNDVERQNNAQLSNGRGGKRRKKVSAP
jgi:hypothetical protein